MNYIECLDHPALFGKWFADDSWAPWRVIERAIFGLPMPEADMPLFTELTGRVDPPTRQASEVWVIAGRRTAKSRKAATIATYMATIGAEVMGYRKALAPGERGVVLVMAVSKQQANIVLDYARALFRAIPMFNRLVERDTPEGLELRNGMSLLVLPNDFRAIRGRTLAACILDEVAYWRSELTRRPDVETYRAAKPALSTIPGSLLIGISSAYRRAGLLWSKFRRHWGQAGDVLVVKAPTEVLNPLISKQLIEEALEDDPEAARAEWMSEFRDDLSDYVRREVVEAAVIPGLYERGPLQGIRYQAFTQQRQLHLGHRASGERRRCVGRAARAQRTVCTRGSGRRVRPSAAWVPHKFGHRRPLCWRMAARAVQEARHHVSAEREDEERDLPGELAAAERPASRITGRRPSRQPDLRSGAADGARREGQRGPSADGA
jgi:hypothetical protein